MPFSGPCYLARYDLMTDRVWIHVKLLYLSLKLYDITSPIISQTNIQKDKN